MAATLVAPSELSSEEIQSALNGLIPSNRVLVRPIDLIAWASDASFYRLIPKAVIQTKTVDEIRALFAFSHQTRIPMTFRSGGTSLSGQAVSDGLLVETARNWRDLQVEDGGKTIRLQPGVIGARANQALVPYRAKIGPDPASISTCTLGGILSNNSSGMCCGVEQNAYHTLASMKFLLPSGTFIDTAQPNADEEFHAREPQLARGVLELKARLEADPALRDRVRSKYRMKNTTGYSLNAFLDFDRASRHLPACADRRRRHAGLHRRSRAQHRARSAGQVHRPAAVPGSPRRSGVHHSSERRRSQGAGDHGSRLAAFCRRQGRHSAIDSLAVAIRRRLLAEFQSADESARPELEKLAAATVGGLQLCEPAQFTHLAREQALLWQIRAGMFPSVGSVRKSGTTVIIEDVAFPVESLANAADGLNKLFTLHGYDNAIIFGHAKDGNLHFVITQSFNTQAAIDQYSYFIDDVVKLVVDRYDGALKAEHGTGRNMAPFVETEWGHDGYEIMRRLKELADPDNLLNPGVIINPDHRSHLANLKQLPSVEPEIDKCIECGYCEPKCASRELTLTPRQRIVVRREMTRLQQTNGDSPLYASIDRDFPYMAIDTCATDGLCATACPVSIDTGQLIKRFRNIRASAKAHRWAARIARNFALAERSIRLALRLGHITQNIFGVERMRSLTRAMQHVFGENLSEWTPDTPYAAGPVPRTQKSRAKAIYFPSCISRVMGRLPGEPNDRSLMEVVVDLASRAGSPVYIPGDVKGTCCGTPFSSKGFTIAQSIAVNQAVERFWRWSEQGRLPIVVDTSPCTYAFKGARFCLTDQNQERFDKLQFVDAIEFVHDELLPKLAIKSKSHSVALHPVCSVTKMGIGAKLEAIAHACSDEVTIPIDAGCCGFAGDRGFLFPELTESATKLEAAEIAAKRPDECYSSSRTCEIGMTRATGQIYRSYMYLLEKATR